MPLRYFRCNLCSREIDIDGPNFWSEHTCNIHVADESDGTTYTAYVFCRECIVLAIENKTLEDGSIIVEPTKECCVSCKQRFADRRIIVAGSRNLPVCNVCLRASLQ